MKILSFDIGGTKIACALVDEKGKIIGDVKKFATPESADKIKTEISKIVAEEKFDGLAFASAGVVFDNGLERKPINLPDGFQNIDFSGFSDVPVIVENDANAAAWCEYKIGNAQNCRHCIVLAIGTGVGCGIICDRRLLKGKSGAAGECSFKISGKDLALMAEKYNLNPDCFALKELARKNDKFAAEVIDEWQKNLFEALVCLNDLFDTEKIILSGSLAKIVDYQLMRENFRNRAYGEPPVICQAVGHDFPALVGAALLWFENYKKEI